VASALLADPIEADRDVEGAAVVEVELVAVLSFRGVCAVLVSFRELSELLRASLQVVAEDGLAKGYVLDANNLLV